jgi:hypothetical protein
MVSAVIQQNEYLARNMLIITAVLDAVVISGYAWAMIEDWRDKRGKRN